MFGNTPLSATSSTTKGVCDVPLPDACDQHVIIQSISRRIQYYGLLGYESDLGRHGVLGAHADVEMVTMRRASAFVCAAGLGVQGRAVGSWLCAHRRPRSSQEVQSCRSSWASGCSNLTHLSQSVEDDSLRVGMSRVMRASAKQMESEWNDVKVIENSEACENHRYVVIDVGTTAETGSLCDSFRVPGMYVKMRQDENNKPGFFAISCAPNIQGIFEFLIKETAQTEWISKLKPGDKVHMSPVMGKGFPIKDRLSLTPYPPVPEGELPRDVLLFATGSGIAPIRSAIESMLNGLNPRQRRSVKLYYGARYPRRMAYKDRFKLWESDHVQVIPVMSRPDQAEEKWTGCTGYIQDVLKEDGIAHPSQTGALLCGVQGMTDDVKSILLDAGVREDRILFNF